MKFSNLLDILAKGTASPEEQLAACVWMQRAHNFAKEIEAALCNYEDEEVVALTACEAQDLHNFADDIALDFIEIEDGDRAPFFGPEGGAA